MPVDQKELERRAMQPCDKGPKLDQIERKLDTMTELLVAVAEQKIDTKYTHKRLDDHEDRIKSIEDQPVKRLMVVYAALVSVIGSLFVWIARQ